MEDGRPLDFLNNSKGKLVSIKTKDSKTLIEAQLISFDIHINLVIIRNGKLEFIKGDNVSSIRGEDKF